MEENKEENENVVNEEEAKEENKEAVNEKEVKEENKEAVNKEKIKEETVKTAKEVKETIKNVDIKKDAKATTNFIVEMVKRPLVRLQEIAEEKNHKDFKYAILLIIVWIISLGIVYLSNYYSIKTFFQYNFVKNILSLVKIVVAPVVGIIIMSAIVFLMNKENKKSFVTTLTAITSAHIPTIVASILGILRLISSNITKLLTPVSSFCSVLSIVFLFYAIKALFGEKNETKFLKTFVIIEAIYYVAYLLISYLEIYI